MISPWGIHTDCSWWLSCCSHTCTWFPGLAAPLPSQSQTWGWLVCHSLSLPSCPSWWPEWYLLSASPHLFFSPLHSTLFPTVRIIPHLGIALQWHLPTLPALLHTFPPGPWAYIRQFCLSIPSSDPLPEQHIYLPPPFHPCFWEKVFLEAGLTGKKLWQKGRSGPEPLPCLVSPGLHLIQQQAHVLPSLPFAIHPLTEALLVAFDTTSQVLYRF